MFQSHSTTVQTISAAIGLTLFLLSPFVAAQEKTVQIEHGEWWKHGDLVIKVSAWQTEMPELTDTSTGRVSFGKEKKFCVTLRFINENENKILFFDAASHNLDDKKNASLRDNFDNPYRLTRYPGKFEGIAYGKVRIEPKKNYYDHLYFETVIDKADAVFLKLPGASVGADESPVFKIQLKKAEEKPVEPKKVEVKPEPKKVEPKEAEKPKAKEPEKVKVSPITRANYDLIQKGWTLASVNEMLGNADKREAISKSVVMTWDNGARPTPIVITIIFNKDNKVIGKSIAP